VAGFVIRGGRIVCRFHLVIVAGSLLSHLGLIFLSTWGMADCRIESGWLV
jgi:hypothetical protein